MKPKHRRSDSVQQSSNFCLQFSKVVIFLTIPSDVNILSCMKYNRHLGQLRRISCQRGGGRFLIVSNDSLLLIHSGGWTLKTSACCLLNNSRSSKHTHGTDCSRTRPCLMNMLEQKSPLLKTGCANPLGFV